MFILSLYWVYKAILPSIFQSHFGLLLRMSAIPAAIQSLMTLLESCGCSSSHRHVVAVHHGDGSVERHPSAAPVPDSTLLRWKLFPEATTLVLKMTFNEPRSEATRILKHFVNNPIPWPKANTDSFCSVPELWMTSVPVTSLPLSKVAILRYKAARHSSLGPDPALQD